MPGEHVIGPFLCDVAGLHDLFACAPPGKKLVGATLQKWNMSVVAFRSAVDVTELRARLLYTAGRPSVEAYRKFILRARFTRSFESACKWLEDFANSTPVGRLAPPRDTSLGVFFLPTQDVTARVAVYRQGKSWEIATVVQGLNVKFQDDTPMTLGEYRLLSDLHAQRARLPVRLDLVSLDGAWTYVANPQPPQAPQQQPQPQTWPPSLPAGFQDAHGFKANERIAAFQGETVSFGIAVGPAAEPNKVRVVIWNGVNQVNATRLLTNVVRAPYGLHNGHPPPPRMAPDTINRVTLTRRDISGESACQATEADLNALITTWDGLQRPCVGFDMEQYLGERNVNGALHSAEKYLQYILPRTRRRDVLCPIPPDRRAELKHEMRKWIGAGVSMLFAVKNQRKSCTRYTGVVSGVFLNREKHVVYVVRFKQGGDPNKTYLLVMGRYELNLVTQEEPKATADVDNQFLLYGDDTQRSDYDFNREVKDKYDASKRNVAKVFINPTFYAVVTEVKDTGVVLDFGDHYAEFHGTRTRLFSTRDAERFCISIMKDEDLKDWHKNQQDLEAHNALLALRFASNKQIMYKDRNWLFREDTKQDYTAYFKQRDATHGSRMAVAWLCYHALSRLRYTTPPRLQNVTKAGIVNRLADAVKHASQVIPAFAAKVESESVGGNDDSADEGNEPADEEDESTDGDEETLECEGFPGNWTFGWSASRTTPQKWVKTNVASSFKKTWVLSKVTLDGNDALVADTSDVHYGDGFKIHCARLFTLWRPDITDPLYIISKSSMMNSAQLSGLYATIGSRNHFRLAAHALVGDLPAAPGNAPVSLARYTATGVFFAPLLNPTEPYHRDNLGNVTATNVWLEFARANDASLRYDQFTRFARDKFVLSETGENILACAFSSYAGKTYDFELAGIEVPVFNPQCIFAHKKTFRFFQTQADFVGLLTPRAPEVGDTEVVVGDYKFLMESNNPQSRVLNWKNVSQVLTNAMLFEKMTGVRPTYGALIYFTRREASEAYVLFFPLKDKPEVPKYIDKEEPFRNNILKFRKLVEMRTLFTLSKKDGICVYADDKRVAVFPEAHIKPLTFDDVKLKLKAPSAPKNAHLLSLRLLSETTFTLMEPDPQAAAFGYMLQGAGQAGDVNILLRQELNQRVRNAVERLRQTPTDIDLLRESLIIDRLGPVQVDGRTVDRKPLPPKTENVTSFLTRALNSLVNDRVQREFFAGDKDMGRAKRFIHDSKRSWWTEQALRHAIDNIALDEQAIEERKT